MPSEKNDKIKVALHGALGRMGRAILKVATEEGAGVRIVAAFDRPGSPEIGTDLRAIAGLAAPPIHVMAPSAAALEGADVVIDFSAPEASATLFEMCQERGLPAVVGTTGFGAKEEAAADALAASVPLVTAPNMSVGVTLLFHLAELAAKLAGPGFDAEIVEMHHRNKVDAPSGTARRLYEHVARAKGIDAPVYGREGQVGARPSAEIGVMTLRGGDVVGEHTLILAGMGERLELTHRATDRAIFARGALRAACWVVGQAPGRYGMAEVIGVSA